MLNVETTHISPLKMYEYFAAALPVVSTAIPAALRKNNIVAIATGSAEFAERCEAALLENSDRLVNLRVEEANSNTWDHRVQEISELVRSWLKKRSSQRGGVA